MGKAGIVHERYAEDLLFDVGKRAIETETILKDNRIIDSNKMSLLLFILKFDLWSQFKSTILPEACVSSLSSLRSLQTHIPTDIPLMP